MWAKYPSKLLGVEDGCLTPTSVAVPDLNTPVSVFWLGVVEYAQLVTCSPLTYNLILLPAVACVVSTLNTIWYQPVASLNFLFDW